MQRRSFGPCRLLALLSVAASITVAAADTADDWRNWSPSLSDQKTRSDRNTRSRSRQQLSRAVDEERSADSPHAAHKWTVISPTTCDGKEVRYVPCHEQRCSECTPVHCVLKEWSEWSDGDCTGLCQRERDIGVQKNECGHPCEGNFIETKRCPTTCHKVPRECPASIDCEWDDWSQWSACTAHCGGGQRTRYRDIKSSPQGNGTLCAPRSKSQVAPCRTQPCVDGHCVDGKWSEWGRWGKCSAPCGGGVRWRRRRIVTEANECGRPAEGDDKEFEECNAHSCSQDVDCRFSTWAHWSDCSCPCDGVKHRAREIAAHGKAGGKFCDGPTTEVAPCNLAMATPGCQPVHDAPEHCMLSDWQEWSECSTTCGPGQSERKRSILKHAKNGGEPCTGVLTMAVQCHGQPECHVVNHSKSCLWGDWTEWGACERCGGERKRFRHIAQMPENGGAACRPEASEEIGDCPRQCHDRFFCEWAEWAEAGECSATCGEGNIKHVRYLKPTETPVLVTDASGSDVRHDHLAPRSAVRDFLRDFGVPKGMEDGESDEADMQPAILTLRLEGASVGFLAGAAGMLALWAATGRTRRSPDGYVAVGLSGARLAEDEASEGEELLGPRGSRGASSWLRSEAAGGLE